MKQNNKKQKKNILNNFNYSKKIKKGGRLNFLFVQKSCRKKYYIIFTTPSLFLMFNVHIYLIFIFWVQL